MLHYNFQEMSDNCVSVYRKMIKYDMDEYELAMKILNKPSKKPVPVTVSLKVF